MYLLNQYTMTRRGCPLEIIISSNTSKPIYEQITSQIKAKIMSGELTAACPNIPWRSIRATRNLFAHAYGNVSARITWQTIREDIPELRENCRKILASGETEGD